MTTTEHVDPNADNAKLRWARAASWARGQSMGPWGQPIKDHPACTPEALEEWDLESMN